MITLKKTNVCPRFDSGTYLKTFLISNEFLNTYCFDSKDSIWDILSVKFALIVEEEIMKKMKLKMNKEVYEKEFNISKQDTIVSGDEQ